MTPILQTELPELIRNEIKSIQVKDAYLIQRSKSRGLSTARVALTISRWNVQESSLARLKMRSTRHSIGTTSGSYAARRGHDEAGAAGFQSGRHSSDEGLGGALADRRHRTS